MIRPDIVLSLGAAVAALGLTSPQLVAQGRLFPNDSSVQAILNEQVTAKKTVGIVVGLLDADGTRRVLTAGRADNKGLVLDGNTVFEIGSITKTFTASLLADMVARGEVRLSDRVQQYLPASVKIPTRNGREITLLDVVTVSSGLPGMPSNFKPADPGNPYADYTVRQMYDFLSGYTLPRDIGSKYEYSNLGMGLLGHTLALKAGKSYYDLLNDRILTPLRMGDTEIILSPRLEDGALWAAATGQPKVRLIAESDSSFFITEDDIGISFVKEGGVVTRLILRQGGGGSPAKKIR